MDLIMVDQMTSFLHFSNRTITEADTSISRLHMHAVFEKVWRAMQYATIIHNTTVEGTSGGHRGHEPMTKRFISVYGLAFS